MLHRLRASPYLFWGGLAAWFAALSVLDLLTGGQMRPLLVLVLLGGSLALYVALRPTT